MNKYTLFGVLLFFLIIVTYIVDVTQTYTVTGGITERFASADEVSITSVGSMVKTFFNLMFFQVEGLPVIINLIIFHPIAGVFFFMGLDIIKDLIPFT